MGPNDGGSYIVLHTVVGTKESAVAAFQSAARQASAHYIVGMDGSLVQMVDEKDAAWHAGDYGVNLDSIGIEHADDGAYDSPRPDALYKTSARLVAEICKRYGLPCQRGDSHTERDGMIDHRSVSATRCPDSLDTDRIIREAAEYMAGRDPYAPKPEPKPEPQPKPQPGPDGDTIEDRGHAAHEHEYVPPMEVPPMADDKTRSDLDNLMAKIAETMAKGDGIEPGFLTTEFWLMVLALAADVAAPYINLSLSGDERMYIAAGLVSVYGAFRAWRKRGGPAKLYADLLARLAELRHAAA